MTVTEIKKLIAASPNKDFYQKKQLSINYKHLNYQKLIKGIPSIYEFVFDQVAGFQQLELTRELIAVQTAFENVKERIAEYVKSENTIDNDWDRIAALITGNSPVKFLSDLPETELLVKLNKLNAEYYTGAFQFFTGNIQSTTSRDRMVGHHLAAEFMSSEIAVKQTKKEAELKQMKISLSNYRQTLDECQAESVEFIKFVQDESKKIAGDNTLLHEETKKLFDDLFQSANTELGGFHTASAEKMTDLEKLYSDKLKLEAPAKYWNQRASKLRKEGNQWLKGLIGCIIVAIASLVVTLFALSNGSLALLFKDPGTAIKWSVLFITFVSFLAYAIRIFSKLTFSSYHLVRDSEEREQLTYVYLALQNAKGIDQTERHLIMQSLFSRADSGLLKDEASPTMPGNITDKMFQSK